VDELPFANRKGGERSRFRVWRKCVSGGGKPGLGDGSRPTALGGKISSPTTTRGPACPHRVWAGEEKRNRNRNRNTRSSLTEEAKKKATLILRMGHGRKKNPQAAGSSMEIRGGKKGESWKRGVGGPSIIRTPTEIKKGRTVKPIVYVRGHAR